jgi:hypothetical protein
MHALFIFPKCMQDRVASERRTASSSHKTLLTFPVESFPGHFSISSQSCLNYRTTSYLTHYHLLVPLSKLIMRQ